MEECEDQSDCGTVRARRSVIDSGGFSKPGLTARRMVLGGGGSPKEESPGIDALE